MAKLITLTSIFGTIRAKKVCPEMMARKREMAPRQGIRLLQAAMMPLFKTINPAKMKNCPPIIAKFGGIASRLTDSVTPTATPIDPSAHNNVGK